RFAIFRRGSPPASPHRQVTRSRVGLRLRAHRTCCLRGPRTLETEARSGPCADFAESSIGDPPFRASPTSPGRPARSRAEHGGGGGGVWGRSPHTGGSRGSPPG